MKKLAAFLLAAAMAFTCVACGGNAGNAGNSGNGGSTEIKDATEILTKAWAEYNNKVSEDYKFPVGGGNICKRNSSSRRKPCSVIKGLLNVIFKYTVFILFFTGGTNCILSGSKTSKKRGLAFSKPCFLWVG